MDRSDRLGSEPLLILLVFVDPVGTYYRIFAVVDNSLAINFVHQHARNSQKGRSRRIKKREHGVVHDVLHACRPDICPDLGKNGHKTRRYQMFVVGIFYLENVEADWVLRVDRIKVDYVLETILWDGSQQALNKFSVRIHDRHATACFDVLYGKIAQERCLAGSSLSDYIHVLEAILVFNTKNLG